MFGLFKPSKKKTFWYLISVKYQKSFDLLTEFVNVHWAEKHYSHFKYYDLISKGDLFLSTHDDIFNTFRFFDAFDVVLSNTEDRYIEAAFKMLESKIKHLSHDEILLSFSKYKIYLNSFAA